MKLFIFLKKKKTLLLLWISVNFSLSCIGEGNGNPLQCSCLENPRDEEAWWAAVYGVAQSRTRLKRLSSSSSSSSSSSKCPPKEQKWIFDSLSRIRRQRPLGPQAKVHVTISKDQEWARCELHLTKTLQHGLDTCDSVPHWIEILSPLSFYLLERLVLSQNKGQISVSRGGHLEQIIIKMWKQNTDNILGIRGKRQ